MRFPSIDVFWSFSVVQKCGLSSVKRQLMVKFKHLNDKLQSVKKSELANIPSEFNEVESFFNEFKSNVKWYNGPSNSF